MTSFCRRQARPARPAAASLPAGTSPSAAVALSLCRAATPREQRDHRPDSCCRSRAKQTYGEVQRLLEAHNFAGEKQRVQLAKDIDKVVGAAHVKN